MIAKFMRTIRFYILPVIQAKKTRFIIVSGFIIFFHIIAVLMTTGEFKIDILKGMGISAISYVVVKSIVTVIGYAGSMKRDQPWVKSSFILYPGRYYRSLNGGIKERHDSPVNDHDEFCLFLLVIFCLTFIPFFDQLQAGDIKEAQLILYFQTGLLSAFFTILLKIPAYETEYNDNLKKAKRIFMECGGNREQLDASEEYYEYQVDIDTEQKWYKEIEMKEYEWIRPYQKEDLSQILCLFYETVHHINAKDYTKEQLDVWADGKANEKVWNEHLAQNTTLVYVRCGEILGFADMEENGYLDHLFIHKDHQNEGIATKLCNRLEKQSNAEMFSTHASITAKPFFLNRGYKVVKKQQVERKGILLTNYIMQKENKIREK